MPRKPENRGINITMSPAEKERVKELALKRGYKMTSDYVRWLIEQDAKDFNEFFEFQVDRGGDRRSET